MDIQAWIHTLRPKATVQVCVWFNNYILETRLCVILTEAHAKVTAVI